MAEIKSQLKICVNCWQSKPDKNAGTIQDTQSYKQIILLSNAHILNYIPTGKIKANNGLKYPGFISQRFTDKNDVPWESVQ